MISLIAQAVKEVNDERNKEPESIAKIIAERNILAGQVATIAAERDQIAESYMTEQVCWNKYTDGMKNEARKLTAERDSFEHELNKAKALINRLEEDVAWKAAELLVEKSRHNGAMLGGLIVSTISGGFIGVLAGLLLKGF